MGLLIVKKLIMLISAEYHCGQSFIAENILGLFKMQNIVTNNDVFNTVLGKVLAV